MLSRLLSRPRGDIETQLFLSDLETVLLERGEESPAARSISVPAPAATSAGTPPDELASASSVATSEAPSHSSSEASTAPSSVGDPDERPHVERPGSLVMRWFSCPSLWHRIERVPSSHEMQRASTCGSSAWSDHTAASDADDSVVSRPPAMVNTKLYQQSTVRAMRTKIAHVLQQRSWRDDACMLSA